MAISLIKKIKKVLVNGTEVPLNLPNIQASKSVSVTGTQEITPDSGYDAIAKVIATAAATGNRIATGTVNAGLTQAVTVNGLSFKPSKIIYFCTEQRSDRIVMAVLYTAGSTADMWSKQLFDSEYQAYTANYGTCSATVTGTYFKFTASGYYFTSGTWFAIE